MIAGMGMLAFVTRDGLGSGPNLSCTVLYLGLMQVARLGQIGAKLNILLDNTAGDNKNNEMIYFLAWLVATNVVDESSFFCMLKGHTYSRIDQTFRTLIGQLLSVPVWTVTVLLRLIHQFLRPYNCVDCIELHCLWDWKAFFAPHVHERFSGFCTGQFGSGMHEFVLRKNAAGEVRLWLRKSSAASSWLPEGDGYLVFKSLPSGQPALAKAKADHVWGRSTVESTVRQWYPFMSVGTAEKAGIKQDWEARFEALPVGGDTSLLPPSLLPKWYDLPKFQPVRGPSVVDLHCHSSSMENPPINPVTGRGRTAAQVQAEMGAYRQRVRSSGSAQHLAAIFQADFLFVKPPGGSLALHRVANGLCIDDATAKDAAFTTVEYTHSPQAGFDGFWGTFTLRENTDYNANDKRTGTKFVRHQQMTRENVVLFDVQTFTSARSDGEAGNQLRVSSVSLRALFDVSSHPSIPSVLPPAHQMGAAQGRAARRRGSQPPQKARHQDVEDVESEEEVEDVEDLEVEEQAGTEGEGDGKQSDQGEDLADEAAEVVPARRVIARDGAEMEMQMCDVEACPKFCTDCTWRPCSVSSDHGGECNVWLQCSGVATRFLRTGDDGRFEVKACDPEACADDCEHCDWETCLVDSNNGTTCDIMVHRESIPNRLLRMPSNAAAKRRRNRYKKL